MTLRGHRGAFRRLAASTVVVIGLGTALGACGDSGTALAQQACAHVNRSIALLQQAGHQSDATRAGQLQEQAYIQLRQALPVAAEAAFHDGQWQALMTSIAESSRVPEGTLITALTAQCQAADSSVFGQPSPSSSIPPPASDPPSP
ncbi:MAG: hypothetical protein ACLQPH_10515 [Acidimicrobiales bacterium]